MTNIDAMIHITDPSVDNNIICISDCTWEELTLESKFYVKQKKKFHSIQEIEQISRNLFVWGETDTDLINLETKNYNATMYFQYLFDYLVRTTGEST